ncbi:MAG: hypothetical protein VB108_01345 [Anaerolineaceae bacterium]|nr:hypothetical protein [Anaerolineaceae bacterium]
MTKNYYMIQMYDTKAADFLREMAAKDLRSLGNQVAWLIRQEYARRQVSNDPQYMPHTEPLQESAAKA